jgi:hypothetical protein
MISRLVTVDLILTAAQRLHQLPEYQGLDLKALYQISKQVLNEWAKRIEAEGLLISLRAIVENTFLVFAQPDEPIDSLLKLGNELIDAAGQIEFWLSADRWLQPDQTRSLQELENAVGDKQSIDWFAGAKQIIGIKNSTEASNTLKEAFAWLLNDRNAPENSILRKFLIEAINGQKPVIPFAFASLFKDRYLWVFNRIAASKSVRNPKKARQRRKKNRNPTKSV